MSGSGRWLGVTVLATAAVACGQRVNVCAEVGRHKVEVEAFQAYLGAVTGQGWQSVDERVAGRLLDQFLDQEVVAAAARVKRPMRIPIEPGERAATVRSLLAEVCAGEPALDPAEVQRELERRLQQLQPARAHVRQMLLDGAEEADSVRRRLAAGEDFIELSRDASRAPNAAEGGEIGFLVQGTLPPELDQVVFALKTGEISQPVPGPSGFHIFQVLEFVPAGPPDRRAEEVRVMRELRERQARDLTRDCIARLAREAGVTVLSDHLWFSYEGRYADGGRGTGVNNTTTPPAGE
jgi:hypothetical protein